MNVQTTDINETRKTLTVTLDKGEVDGEYQTVLGQFSQQARLPGFRPGKAPAALIERRFGKELREEFKDRVVGKAYREGLEQAKLNVVSLVDVEQGEVAPGLSAAIKLTVDIRPEFTVPEYTGLPTEVSPTEPTAAEINGVIDGLRADRADFQAVDRAAEKGDFVRFGYEGALDGRPLSEVVGDKALYAKAPQTWEEAEGANEGVLPGLAKQLTGRKAGDKFEASVTFPAEFGPVPALAGKTASYAIDVQEVRTRVLPPLDEKFFKDNQVESLEALQDQVKRTLAARKEQENRSAQRRQITDRLLERASFPAPESLVAGERDGILRQFIEENMRRGVPQEEFEKGKKELFESATRAATARVKIQLILGRIAEAEKLKVEEKDLNNWLMREAMRSGQRVDKLARDLGKDREHLRAVQMQLLYDKTLDFLVSKATVTTAKANA